MGGAWLRRTACDLGSSTSGRLTAAAAGLLVLYLGWFFLGRGTAHAALLNDLAYLPPGLLGIAWAWRASTSVELESGARRGWRLLALALVATLIGDLLWLYYEVIAGEPPFPSWADAAYLATYPLCLGGLLTLARSTESRTTRVQFALDLVLVLLGGGLVVWHLLLLPALSESSTGGLIVLLAVAYPAGDLVLLFGATTLALRHADARRRAAMHVLATAFLLQIVGNVVFGYLSVNGIYSSPGWSDPAWMASRFLLLLAPFLQLWRPHRAPIASPTFRVRRLRLLPLASIGLPVWLLFTATRDGLGGEFATLLYGTTAMIVLVVIRQVIALRENASLFQAAQQAERESRGLYEAALRSAGTLDLRERLERLLERVLTLLEVDAGYVLLGRGPTLELVASRGADYLPHEGQDLAQHALASASPVCLEGLDRGPRSDGACAVSSSRSWLCVPLVEAGGPFGVVAVTRSAGRAFCDGDTRVLLSFAALATGAVREARLHRQAQEELVERKRSESRFRLAAQSASDLIYDWDVAGQRVEWFGDVDRQLGYEPGEFPRTLEAWQDLLHPEDRLRVLAALTRHVDTGAPFAEEYRVRRKDGSYLYWSDRGAAEWDESGRPVRMVGACTNVTERMTAEEALRASEERYALAARAANDGLWDWDLEAERVYYSPRWKAMLGYREGEVGSAPEEWLGRLHPDDASGVRSAIAAHLEGSGSHLQCEYGLRHADGSYRRMLVRAVAVRDPHGRAVRLAGSQADITARKAAEEQLMHDALHDSLTGLPNRPWFMERLATAVARARGRSRELFGVLFLDVDRFKLVNDSLGHVGGDRFLVAIAHRLAACLRPSDTVARFGGDEFAVLVHPAADVADVVGVAERIQRELARPFHVDGQEVFASVSIGITMGASEHERADDLLRDADIAMYRAKALGKARHVVFDPSMRARAQELLGLETDLRRALDRQELTLHYQPIFALDTDRPVGFEALLRWRHPERGLVPPSEFVPFAEETGLIVAIGDWVVQEACRQLGEWRRRWDSPLFVSVNVSARQCVQGDLVERIASALRVAQLSPSDLKLEITEGTLIESVQTASDVLERLRSLGVGLQVDDFGTGYSSLSYLRRFPVDALKIDKSFVGRLGTAEEDLEIVRAIATMAQNLGLMVVAEGVETRAQLEALRALGCGYAQGYLISKPLEPAGAAAFLERELALPQARVA